MRKIITFAFLAAAAVGACVGSSHPAAVSLPASQPATQSMAAPPAAPPQVVTRVYDVGAILMFKPDYGLDDQALPVLPPIHEGVTTVSGPVESNNIFGAASPDQDLQSRQDRVDSLVSLITRTIDRDSWKDAGGSTGSIVEFDGTQFVVQQTPAAQEKIRQLLSDLTSMHLRAVRMHFTWLLLTADQFKAMCLPPAEDAHTPVSKSTVRIDEQALQKAKPYCSGDIAAFDGQDVNLVSGVQRRIVSDYTVINNDNSATLQPNVANVLSGVALQASPVLVPERNSVVLRLWGGIGKFTESPPAPLDLKLPATQPAPATHPAPAQPLVFRPKVLGQRIGESIEMPLGVSTLVSSMTLDPAAGADPPKQLYLIVKVEPTAAEK